MRALGHTVELINTVASAWWDDCTELAAAWTVVPIGNAKGYDLCIECGPLMLDALRRARITTKSIWVLNTPFLLREIEFSTFPIACERRDFEGIAESWLMDENNTEDDRHAVEIISGRPARLVPYMWSSSIIRAYSSATPEWTPGPWRLHIIETHTTNTSSCVIPLVIAEQLTLEHVCVHNAEALSNSRYFKENTLDHCPSFKPEFIGRQRIADWLAEPGSCAITHMRFRRIRPALLDLAWCGIPFIHNSPALKGVEALAPYYYSANRIEEAVRAFAALAVRPDRAIVRAALERWSPAIIAKGLVPLPLAPTLALAPRLAVAAAPTIFRIGFCDMWENFNPEYNFFTLLLSAAAPQLQIVGGPAQGNENIVIFGPFGTRWQSLPAAQPKVHFTGENTGPLPADLNLGFQHRDMVGDEYLRFPLWILEIDWFGADAARLRNPVPIPLAACTTPSVSSTPRPKFCAFVVSNPGNPVRNAAFEALNAYSRVDSAGAVFNNMGPGLFAGAGGGGGEARKVAFLRDYRFCITYENNSAPGYCTEKLLHAKAAGCVPIYWGDPRAERDFNMDGCIDARTFRTGEELVAAVRAVEENPAEWQRKASIPALDPYKVEWAQRTMAELARRLLNLRSTAPRSTPTYVINLDRRPDRLQRLGVRAERWPAVDGRSLRLTPALRKLLAPNDFFWKKAVAGCALSHLGLWKRIATQGSAVVLEDDAVLAPGWERAIQNLPPDLDILYLGGVLPPNRKAYEGAVEPAGHLGRIRPNQFFGQPTPNRYFHFCAYAYYLTARGAKRIVDLIEQRGIWTSADHILCNPDILTAYVARPLVAGCYQDTDPVYQASKFNDFSRVDTFDSDLWNNNERFDPECAEELVLACAIPLDLSGLYEYEWLCNLFELAAPLQVVPLSTAPANALVIVQHPYLEKTLEVLASRTEPFNVLHLSDEFCKDPLDFYAHPACKRVIRNYHREVSSAVAQKVTTIPLGYHWTVTSKSVPKLPFRAHTWSFAGTDWRGREALRTLPPDRSVLRLFPKWQDPANLGREEYLALLLDSVFAPCPAGNNAETFRIYEALECGAIPLVLGEFVGPLPLIRLASWAEAGDCITHLMANPDKLEVYRDKLLGAWTTMKGDLQKSIRSILI